MAVSLSTGPATGPGRPLTVMTRNVYLGTDIARPVVAAVTAEAEGRPGQDVLVALANAAHEGRAIVDRTDFTVRARLLAREFTQVEPDLAGLQEVALWRSGPLDIGRAGVPGATQVDYDFLDILLEALAAEGLHYTPAQVGVRADVEAPSFTGSPFDHSLGPDARNVRLTMRDVILVRTERPLQVTGEGDVVFADNLVYPVAGSQMRVDRGYHWVDVVVGTTSLRFVNSHLEAFSADVALAQATEILATATATDRVTVLVCDGNADPLDRSTKPGDSVPTSAPYDAITGPGGFADEWLRWSTSDPGWTAEVSELADDPTADGFDRRIDMVFARAPDGDGLPVDGGMVTGTSVTDRDPLTGLWPSDHGGVALRLRGL
jgi:hypothetical protein